MNKRKNKKSFPYGLFFLLLIVLICVVFFYIYGDFSSIKTPSKTEEENATSVEQTEKSEQNQKVLLSKDLLTPVCSNVNPGDHELRTFEYYSLCYRESYEQAEWSAEYIEPFMLEKVATRSNDFRADEKISTGSATLADYKSSGYDRGHLVPAADMSFDQNAMSETFYMSNMSPQAPQFNRGIWVNLETQVRDWVKTFGKLYVVSGPVLEKSAEEYNSIGQNKVSVPEYYYKVILAPLYKDELDKETPEDSDSVIAIAFLIPNQKCEDDFWSYAVSVDEVEKRTNIDFFSLLPNNIELMAESSFDIEMWK